MRIGIWTQVLHHELSGIGWHVRNLLDALASIDSENEYHLMYRVPFSQRGLQLYRPEAANFVNVPVVVPDLFFNRYFRVFDRWQLPRAISRLSLDVFHGPNHYLPQARHVPQIVTYHDVANVLFSEDKKSSAASVHRNADRSQALISVSQCTAKDLVELGVCEEKVHVIYQGANFDSPEEEISKDQLFGRFGIRDPYILFVGGVGPRKDLPFLVESFARLRERQHCQLVIAGSDQSDSARSLKDLIRSKGIADSVVFTGYASDSLVAALYQHASVFALTSIYEGFGMVILEAMHWGVPVVARSRGAVPEVVGDAGVLVDTESPADFAHELEKLIIDPKSRVTLISKGHEQVRKFSWRQCAEQTLQLYKATARS